MVIKGFDKSTMKKVFEWMLNTENINGNISAGNKHHKFLINKPKLFNTKTCLHEDIVDEYVGSDFITLEDINKIDKKYRDEMALLYLETFYGKKPEEFSSPAYKQECIDLQNKINRSSNPSRLKAKIEQCIRNKSVNYSDGELPEGLFYARLRNIGLSTDDATHGHANFIVNDYLIGARIYVNPSQKYYQDLIMFINKEAAKQELDFGMKTKMLGVGGVVADNLVIYTNNESLGALVEILNKYGKMYPEKIKTFGSSIECLGRSEQDWFGFGTAYQVRLDGGGTERDTFNGLIDEIMNSYVLMGTVMDDFDKITKHMNDGEVSSIFKSICKNEEDSLELAKTFRDEELRNEFLSHFLDLSYVYEKSNKNTEKMKELSEKDRLGYSPQQTRQSTINYKMSSDDVEMAIEIIPIKLKNGKTLNFSRRTLSEIFKSLEFRQAMAKYYDSPEKIEYQAIQMLGLWKNVGVMLPYLDDEYPFLSQALADEMRKQKLIKPLSAKEQKKTIDRDDSLSTTKKDIAGGVDQKLIEYQKSQISIIETLCSSDVNLIMVLKNKGMSAEELSKLTRDELEMLFIRCEGLNNVISAAKYVKALEDKGRKKLNHRYENSLMALRRERGAEFLEDLKAMDNDQQRERFIRACSQYAREDMMSVKQFRKLFSNTDWLKIF